MRICSFKAFLLLLAFDVLGYGRSFSRMHKLVEAWKASPHVPTPETVELVCQAVNRARVWYPKRVLCLQASAVTTCLLRSYGVPSTMVIGSQVLPFKAHAWTEVNGRAVNERSDVQTLYLIWDRC
jgi:hypothetical protein